MYEYKIEKKQCGSEFALDKFNGKWKIRIMCLLGIKGHLRYSEIKSGVEGITDNILSKTMRELTLFGLVERTRQQEPSFKVMYGLTDKSDELMPIVHSLCLWANKFYEAEIESMCTVCPYKDLLSSRTNKE